MGESEIVKKYDSATIVPEYPEIICRDYLPLIMSEVNMLSAGGGIGKTFVALTSALYFSKENPGHMVFLWTTEDTPGLMKVREMAVVNKYLSLGIDFREEYTSITYGYEHEPFMEKVRGVYQQTAYFTKAMDELCRQYSYIVLDPLLNFFGGDNENDNHQARTFISMIKKAANIHKTTFLIIHHGRKGDGSFRGASAFQDSCRLAYEIGVNEQSQMVAKMTKSNYTGRRGDILLDPIPQSDMFPRQNERLYRKMPREIESQEPDYSDEPTPF
ncbi:MAG: AAA family ATPase [Desulfobulbaceae bacterium]|nr:AAA family ATPase [Desulfobulbaceae bacterium]